MKSKLKVVGFILVKRGLPPDETVDSFVEEMIPEAPTNERCTKFSDQHTEFDLHRASLLKQQSADRHVAPGEHIILIPSQPVFAISP